MDEKDLCCSRKKQKKQKKQKNGRGVSFNLEASVDASYGIQPLGNMLFNASLNIRDCGLGPCLRLLSDETLCDILALLSAIDLARLSAVSKGLYVFSHLDFLWRNLVLQDFNGSFLFNGCWRRTYIAMKAPSHHLPCLSLNINGFFSDYLFQSWLCATLELRPEWLSRDNIDRRSKLSVEEFVKKYEEQNKPLIITDALANWPAMKKWDRNYLLEVAGDAPFSVGPVEMRLNDYLVYADSAKEERPLYLFDPRFGEKVPQLTADYEVPEYFKEDLFSILGNERPDFRWLIIGPARSGSSFHIDPNSTSAWNAVIRGSKRWILFPPGVVPPGVHPNSDGSEVASPVSITEWFMNFYEETKWSQKRPVECTCHEGELMFIPNGWWHLVINLEDSVAITQNYVSSDDLIDAWLTTLEKERCKSPHE